MASSAPGTPRLLGASFELTERTRSKMRLHAEALAEKMHATQLRAPFAAFSAEVDVQQTPRSSSASLVPASQIFPAGVISLPPSKNELLNDHDVPDRNAPAANSTPRRGGGGGGLLHTDSPWFQPVLAQKALPNVLRLIGNTQFPAPSGGKCGPAMAARSGAPVKASHNISVLQQALHSADEESGLMPREGPDQVASYDHKDPPARERAGEAAIIFDADEDDAAVERITTSFGDARPSAAEEGRASAVNRVGDELSTSLKLARGLLQQMKKRDSERASGSGLMSRESLAQLDRQHQEFMQQQKVENDKEHQHPQDHMKPPHEYTPSSVATSSRFTPYSGAGVVAHPTTPTPPAGVRTLAEQGRSHQTNAIPHYAKPTIAKLSKTSKQHFHDHLHQKAAADPADAAVVDKTGAKDRWKNAIKRTAMGRKLLHKPIEKTTPKPMRGRGGGASEFIVAPSATAAKSRSEASKGTAVLSISSVDPVAAGAAVTIASVEEARHLEGATGPRPEDLGRTASVRNDTEGEVAPPQRNSGSEPDARVVTNAAGSGLMPNAFKTVSSGDTLQTETVTASPVEESKNLPTDTFSSAAPAAAEDRKGQHGSLPLEGTASPTVGGAMDEFETGEGAVGRKRAISASSSASSAITVLAGPGATQNHGPLTSPKSPDNTPVPVNSLSVSTPQAGAQEAQDAVAPSGAASSSSASAVTVATSSATGGMGDAVGGATSGSVRPPPVPESRAYSYTLSSDRIVPVGQLLAEQERNSSLSKQDYVLSTTYVTYVLPSSIPEQTVGSVSASSAGSAAVLGNAAPVTVNQMASSMQGLRATVTPRGPSSTTSFVMPARASAALVSSSSSTSGAGMATAVYSGAAASSSTASLPYGPNSTIGSRGRVIASGPVPGPHGAHRRVIYHPLPPQAIANMGITKASILAGGSGSGTDDEHETTTYETRYLPTSSMSAVSMCHTAEILREASFLTRPFSLSGRGTRGLDKPSAVNHRPRIPGVEPLFSGVPRTALKNNRSDATLSTVPPRPSQTALQPAVTTQESFLALSGNGEGRVPIAPQNLMASSGGSSFGLAGGDNSASALSLRGSGSKPFSVNFASRASLAASSSLAGHRGSREGSPTIVEHRSARCEISKFTVEVSLRPRGVVYLFHKRARVISADAGVLEENLPPPPDAGVIDVEKENEDKNTILRIPADASQKLEVRHHPKGLPTLDDLYYAYNVQVEAESCREKGTSPSPRAASPSVTKSASVFSPFEASPFLARVAAAIGFRDDEEAGKTKAGGGSSPGNRTHGYKNSDATAIQSVAASWPGLGTHVLISHHDMALRNVDASSMRVFRSTTNGAIASSVVPSTPALTFACHSRRLISPVPVFQGSTVLVRSTALLAVTPLVSAIAVCDDKADRSVFRHCGSSQPAAEFTKVTACKNSMAIEIGPPASAGVSSSPFSPTSSAGATLFVKGKLKKRVICDYIQVSRLFLVAFEVPGIRLFDSADGDATKVVVAGSGHVWLLDEPPVVNAALPVPRDIVASSNKEAAASAALTTGADSDDFPAPPRICESDAAAPFFTASPMAPATEDDEVDQEGDTKGKGEAGKSQFELGFASSTHPLLRASPVSARTPGLRDAGAAQDQRPPTCGPNEYNTEGEAAPATPKVSTSDATGPPPKDYPIGDTKHGDHFADHFKNRMRKKMEDDEACCSSPKGAGSDLPQSSAADQVELSQRRTKTPSKTSDGRVSVDRHLTIPLGQKALGFGFHITDHYVVDVVAGGWAERMGIERGDLLMEVDGHVYTSLTPEERTKILSTHRPCELVVRSFFVREGSKTTMAENSPRRDSTGILGKMQNKMKKKTQLGAARECLKEGNKTDAVAVVVEKKKEGAAPAADGEEQGHPDSHSDTDSQRTPYGDYFA